MSANYFRLLQSVFICIQKNLKLLNQLTMRGGGIEPPRRKAQDPKSCASASSATLAQHNILSKRYLDIYWCALKDSNLRPID